MAALGSGDSGEHTAGAGADDQQLLGLVGGIEGEVILTANQGIDVALADRVHGILGGDAAAGAGTAGSDVVKAVLTGLVGQVGIGQQGTAQSHAVNQPALHDVSSVTDVVNLAHHENRNVDNLLDLGGFIDILADLLAVGGQNVLEALVLNAAGNLQHVNTGCLELGSQIQHLLQRVAAGNTLVAGNTQNDGEVAADTAAALLNDLQNQTGAVVNAAAVLVHTLVAQGGQESTGQHVSMGGVQGDTAAAGFLSTAGSLAVLLDYLMDLVNGDLSADMAIGIGVNRGAQGLDALESTDGLGAGVNDLGEQGAAGVGDALGKGGKLRNQTVLIQSSGLADVPVLVVNGDSVNNDVAHAAFGTAHKNVGQLLGHSAVSGLVMHAHGSHGDAVLQGGLSQLEGAKELGVLHVSDHAYTSDIFSFSNLFTGIRTGVPIPGARLSAVAGADRPMLWL